MNIEQLDGNVTTSSVLECSFFQKDTDLKNDDQGENKENEIVGDDSKNDQSENENKVIESEETENNEEIENEAKKLGVTTYPLKYNLFTFGRIKRELELYKTQSSHDGTWWGYEHEKSLISSLDDAHYKQKLALCKMLSKLRSNHNTPEIHEMMTESEMKDEVKYCFSKTIFGVRDEVMKGVVAA